MKLACQEGIVKGDSLTERLAKLEKWGFRGIEFWGARLWERQGEIEAALAESSVRVSTICAGYGGCPLDPDPAQREVAISDTKRLLRVAGSLGAVGLIFVPIFGGPRLPSLQPFADAVELEKLLLVEMVKELAEVAAENNTLLLLEPLNRYESHLLVRVEDALEIIDRAGSPPGLAVMADFYHMNLVEKDIPAAIQAAGEHLQHIHLGDTPRWLPGLGRTDFRPGLQALKDMGYGNYMAFEAGVTGDPDVQVPESAEFMRAQLAALI